MNTVNSADCIKEIRVRLGLSQAELAQRLGVSFATVNRWERGHCQPSQIALNVVKNLCEENGIDFSACEGGRIMTSEEKIILYHGSKSGLGGPSAAVSRDRCDFGRGFYMWTESMQPLTLICNYQEGWLYTVQAELSGLKILEIEVGLKWALLIAFHRGKMEGIKGSRLYAQYSSMDADCDMVIGYIADDRMFVVLDRFFNGEITDMALVNSLSALKRGRQYVARTEKACRQIHILEERKISEEERQKWKAESEVNRAKGIALADEICRKYRREGQYFDEILKAGE